MFDVVDRVEFDLVSPGWAGSAGCCGRLTGPLPPRRSKPLPPGPPGKDMGPLPVLSLGELAPFLPLPAPRLNLGDVGAGVVIPAEAGVGG